MTLVCFVIRAPPPSVRLYKPNCARASVLMQRARALIFFFLIRNRRCTNAFGRLFPLVAAVTATWQSVAGLYYVVKDSDYDNLWEPTCELYHGEP